MSKRNRLTLAFLEHAPDAAARVMQDLPIEEVASFVDSVPARHSASVLNSMVPWQAARCLELVSPSQAASILRRLPFTDAIGLARLIRAESVEPIIGELPSAYGRRLRGSLRYPLYQVGAWTDPDVPRLRPGDTVKDALRLLRAIEQVSHVFLESEDDGKFLGAIRVREILKAEPSMQLQQLHRDTLEPISNLAPISSIGFDERWDDSLSLPVVGRRGNLLGGLSRHGLRRGMHEHHAASQPGSRAVAEYLLPALLVVCIEILNLTVPSRGFGTVTGAGSTDDEG
jgi:Mg/Co/Ni transporter MgtE